MLETETFWSAVEVLDIDTLKNPFDKAAVEKYNQFVSSLFMRNNERPKPEVLDLHHNLVTINNCINFNASRQVWLFQFIMIGAAEMW